MYYERRNSTVHLRSSPSFPLSHTVNWEKTQIKIYVNPLINQ